MVHGLFESGRDVCTRAGVGGLFFTVAGLDHHLKTFRIPLYEFALSLKLYFFFRVISIFLCVIIIPSAIVHAYDSRFFSCAPLFIW
jgi:hypothetical protein